MLLFHALKSTCAGEFLCTNSSLFLQFCIQCSQLNKESEIEQNYGTCRGYVSVSSNWVHPPRATPGKFFLSEQIPATRANFFVQFPAPGQKLMVEFPGVRQIFPNSKKLPLSLQKILKKFRKLRHNTNFLFGELNKTFIF